METRIFTTPETRTIFQYAEAFHQVKNSINVKLDIPGKPTRINVVDLLVGALIYKKENMHEWIELFADGFEKSKVKNADAYSLLDKNILNQTFRIYSGEDTEENLVKKNVPLDKALSMMMNEDNAYNHDQIREFMFSSIFGALLNNCYNEAGFKYEKCIRETLAKFDSINNKSNELKLEAELSPDAFALIVYTSNLLYALCKERGEKIAFIDDDILASSILNNTAHFLLGDNDSNKSTENLYFLSDMNRRLKEEIYNKRLKGYYLLDDLKEIHHSFSEKFPRWVNYLSRTKNISRGNKGVLETMKGFDIHFNEAGRPAVPLQDKISNVKYPQYMKHKAKEKNSKESDTDNVFAPLPEDVEELFESSYIYNMFDSVKSEEKVVLGRDEEIKQIMISLSKKTKPNVILVGEAGTGKTAIVEEISRQLKYNLCKKFEGYRIVELNITNLVAGTKYRGELESKMEEFIQVMSENKDINLIVFIDEIHKIMGAGASEHAPLDVSNMLKPLLARDNIRMIGATTKDEYEKYICKDKAVMRRFDTIKIEEPQKEKVYTMISAKVNQLQKYHNVKITKKDIDYVIDKASVIKDRYFPDKALDIIDYCMAETSFLEKDKFNKKLVDAYVNNLNKEEEKQFGLVVG